MTPYVHNTECNTYMVVIHTCVQNCMSAA
jgi:hypothetical protein